jgi:hypothetical protein
MTRNRSKKALYEVMSKARIKPEHGKIVEQLRPTTDEDAPAIKQKSAADVPKAAAKWWRKPRIVQLNAGRIEFSMPYQIAVVLVLVFIFVILAAYRLGQSSYSAGRQETDQPAPAAQEMDDERPVERAMSNIPQPSAPPENTTAKTEVAEPVNVKPTGSNVIVLVEYDSLPDLAPVQAHFSEHGIETEIVTEKGRYFLQTKQRYDNPATAGTDGYIAKQKIEEVGAKYKGKAPAGYETFAPFYFSDAYGKKVN